jgi:hypothetical protein
MSPRRLAACLALATAAACASPRTTPPPERSALARLLDLPLEHRGHALTTFVREARPRVLLEVIPPAAFEPGYGDLLPMALDDFDILHVVVETDDPALVLGPGLALVAEGPAGPAALPLYAPTRDLFMAFTRERPAGSYTYHRLKSAGLPWVINLLTVGVLEIATLELKTVEVAPDEAEHARAAPKAQRLATLVTPPHGCAAGRSPCDRYYIVPRPRDDLPVRIDLDLELGDTRVPGLHVTWSTLLPAGKALAARLADRFHGQPIDLEGARVEPGIQRPTDPALCRLTSPRCAATTTARSNTNNTPPPAIPPPARLATPAESRAARPAWSRDTNEVPATTLENYDPADLIPGGPLRDALLVCDFTVRGGSDPDELVAELRVGASRVHRPEVHRHGDQARLVVPLLHLDPGEALGFAVWRRTSSWFWGVQDTSLGRATLPYKGTLPLAHDARGLRLACVALGRDGIERELAVRVAALTQQLASFDLGVDPISEGSPDWGIGSWGMTEPAAPRRGHRRPRRLVRPSHRRPPPRPRPLPRRLHPPPHPPHRQQDGPPARPWRPAVVRARRPARRRQPLRRRHRPQARAVGPRQGPQGRLCHRHRGPRPRPHAARAEPAHRLARLHLAARVHLGRRPPRRRLGRRRRAPARQAPRSRASAPRPRRVGPLLPRPRAPLAPRRRRAAGPPLRPRPPRSRVHPPALTTCPQGQVDPGKAPSPPRQVRAAHPWIARLCVGANRGELPWCGGSGWCGV